MDHSSPPPPLRRTAPRSVYANTFVEVFDDDVAFADGRTGRYLRVVEAGGAPGVAMLALAGDLLALVRTYRYAVDAWEWGIPRGFGHGGDPVASARAELVEELGQAPDGLVALATIRPNSGLLSSTVHLFLARYPRPVRRPRDTGEVVDVRWLDVAALAAEVASGAITDGFTQAALGVGLATGALVR